ncbi:polysaccharide deacetylase family protein [bacterium]|nr:polysaccharide deacetylase family protein [bacterium]
MKKIVVPVVLLGLAALLWPYHKSRNHQLFGKIVAFVQTADSLIALTFDDGPSRAYTDTVLALLRQGDVEATFFVTGQEADEHSDLAAMIVQAGHELGNHSYSHSRLILKSPSRIREEIERTDRAIRNAGQTGPILFRPPFGKKLFILPWILARTGRTTVMWSIEPESRPGIAGSASELTARILEEAKPGAIILLHVMYPGGAASRKALPRVIAGLRARGYRFVTVSSLLGHGAGLRR